MHIDVVRWRKTTHTHTTRRRIYDVLLNFDPQQRRRPNSTSPNIKARKTNTRAQMSKTFSHSSHTIFLHSSDSFRPFTTKYFGIHFSCSPSTDRQHRRQDLRVDDNFSFATSRHMYKIRIYSANQHVRALVMACCMRWIRSIGTFYLSSIVFANCVATIFHSTGSMQSHSWLLQDLGRRQTSANLINFSNLWNSFNFLFPLRCTAHTHMCDKLFAIRTNMSNAHAFRSLPVLPRCG